MIDQIAIRVCELVPRERIKDISVPLHLLYVELVKSKEIVPLAQLSEIEKRNYWNETEGDKFRRVTTCQALYCYDLITRK